MKDGNQKKEHKMNERKEKNPSFGKGQLQLNIHQQGRNIYLIKVKNEKKNETEENFSAFRISGGVNSLQTNI